jgi:invasion protein IalB
MNFSLLRFALLVLGLLALGAGPALTQQKTLAIYGDWTVSCALVSGARSCGLVQTQKIEGQANFVSLVSFARYVDTSPLKVLVEIRADVWIPSGLTLLNGDKVFATVPFKWCTAARCLADADLSQAEVRVFRAQKNPMRLVYKTASQADVSVPVSFNGFSEALDALQKQ